MINTSWFHAFASLQYLKLYLFWSLGVSIFISLLNFFSWEYFIEIFSSYHPSLFTYLAILSEILFSLFFYILCTRQKVIVLWFVPLDIQRFLRQLRRNLTQKEYIIILNSRAKRIRWDHNNIFDWHVTIRKPHPHQWSPTSANGWKGMKTKADIKETKSKTQR